MITKEKIDSLLSELPSYYTRNEAAADDLFSVAVELGVRVSRGCKDCIARAYKAVQNVQRNNYNMNKGNTYLFRADLHSYRMPNSGKALTNANSTTEERKAVYESSIGRRSLFDISTVPTGDVQVIATPKAEVKKETVISSKRKSTKKSSTSQAK